MSRDGSRRLGLVYISNVELFFVMCSWESGAGKLRCATDIHRIGERSLYGIGFNIVNLSCTCWHKRAAGEKFRECEGRKDCRRQYLGAEVVVFYVD